VSTPPAPTHPHALMHGSIMPVEVFANKANLVEDAPGGRAAPSRWEGGALVVG